MQVFLDTVWSFDLTRSSLSPFCILGSFRAERHSGPCEYRSQGHGVRVTSLLKQQSITEIDFLVAPAIMKTSELAAASDTTGSPVDIESKIERNLGFTFYFNSELSFSPFVRYCTVFSSGIQVPSSQISSRKQQQRP